MNQEILYANIGLMYLQNAELRQENDGLRKVVAELQKQIAASAPTAAPATESAAQPAQA